MSTPIHVFVLIDALGWTYIRDRDFLGDILPYRKPLRTILGFSSGAIPAILTGVPPAENGHWNLLYYDPRNSPFWWMRYFSAIPDCVLNNRYGRRLMKELGRRVLGLGPVFECCVSPRLLHHFNWVEKKKLYGPGGTVGAPSIFDDLESAGVNYRVYSYHDCSDDEVIRRAKGDVKQGSASFLFLYLSEMDHFLHDHCREQAKVEARIDWYAGRLRELFDLCKATRPQASMTVFSDHGMTPIERRVDIVAGIEKLKLSVPQDYLAVYDSTMARFWFFTDRARHEIPQALEASSEGRLLSDAELKDFGVFFEDRRFGEAIFLLHPGSILARSDFNGPHWTPQGMHGFHPDDPFSDAILLSSEAPQFDAKTILDVHRCMQQAASSAIGDLYVNR